MEKEIEMLDGHELHCKYDKLIDIENVCPHPDNENNHPPEQVVALSKVIIKDGIRHAIVVSSLSGYINQGHGRLQAFEMIGLSKVPVVFQKFDDPIQEMRVRTSDNKIGEYAEFQVEKFKINLEKHNIKVEDINVEEYGALSIQDMGIHLDVAEVNQGDENSEWSEMPEFQAGQKDIKVILYFKTEEERIDYVKQNNIPITKKQNDQWISRSE